MKMQAILLVMGFVLAMIPVAEAQQAVLLVRHADTSRQQAMSNPDIPLTEAGQRRALGLASLLKESGINVIYTTGMIRTVKTAEPLAKLLAIEPKVYPQLRPGYKPKDAALAASLPFSISSE